jgi:hypothetical protein
MTVKLIPGCAAPAQAAREGVGLNLQQPVGEMETGSLKDIGYGG